MKPSPPITIIKSELAIDKNFIFFSKNNFIFNDFLFVSETKEGLIIFIMVPSARLELALPKGQGF